MIYTILIALGGSLPISPYVTTISFAIYVACRLLGRRRERGGWARRHPEPDEPAPQLQSVPPSR